ncbi:MAG: UDP-N-acetylglucosamine--N-acetylmuramyl-(pentapeptide) pyrophosphoryl-undecaprenol N-acetylglucosamine transferase, partial [Propionibacteriaceae bacterium]
AVPGIANKVAARFSRQVATSFPDTPLPRARFIGLPLRAGITGLDRTSARPAARRTFDLAPDLPTLLVSGGSQGARSINTACTAAVADLLAAGVQVLHVLGPRNFTDAHAPITHEQTGARYRPVAYVDRMADAYAAADLMVCRSGAGTVVETAVVGLPSIFVPLPHGNGEQARNADALVAAEAALVVADQDLDAAWLRARVPELITDPGRLDRMGQAAQGLLPGDAAGVLAGLVLDVARGQGRD